MRAIQDAVLASERIRYRLFEAVQATGPQSLFQEAVPSSLRMGPFYAQQLVRLYLAMLDEYPKPFPDRLVVLEMGAGFGQTSLFFLDALKQKAPDIYDKTVCVISDGFSRKDCPVSHMMDAHKDHVEEYSFIVGLGLKGIPYSVDFAFSTYLLDALPADWIRVVGGRPMISRVSTSIKEDVKWPLGSPGLEGFSAEEPFEKWCSVAQEHPLIARRLVDVIEEARVEGDTELDIGENDAFRSSFWSSVNEGTVCCMSRAIRVHIDEVLGMLSPLGCYVASDFGFFDQSEAEHECQIEVNYGPMLYYSVYFKWLRAYVNSIEGACLMTQRELDQTQECVVSRSEMGKSFKKVFNKVSSCLDRTKLSETIDAIQSFDPGSDYRKVLFKKIKRLSVPEQQDYYLYKTVILQLFQDGFLDDALYFAHEMESVYQSLSFPAFLIQGLAAQFRGLHFDAVSYFNRIIEFSPKCLDYMVLGARAVSLVHTQRVEEALKDYQDCFNVCSLEDQLTVLKKMQDVLDEQSDDRKWQNYRNWIQYVCRVHPDFFTISERGIC